MQDFLSFSKQLIDSDPDAETDLFTQALTERRYHFLVRYIKDQTYRDKCFELQCIDLVLGLAFVHMQIRNHQTGFNDWSLSSRKPTGIV